MVRCYGDNIIGASKFAPWCPLGAISDPVSEASLNLH